MRETKAKDIKFKEVVFAKGLCFYKVFWIFFVGCVLGVLAESLYCFLLFGKFEIRWGVIYGPFNPVYGFGIVIMTFLLLKISKLSNLKIFLFSAFLGGVYEYFCSFFQEFFLGTISWNYKGTFLNFGGRTNFTYSVCWGLLGLFWIRLAYPKISDWIESFPTKFGKISTWVLFFFMILNIFFSSAAVWRYSRRSQGIKPKSSFEIFLDKHFKDDLIGFAYPNIVVTKR